MEVERERMSSRWRWFSGEGGRGNVGKKRREKRENFTLDVMFYFSLPCAVVLARSKCNEAAAIKSAIKFDSRHGMRAES
jgi:hypothetical protein